MTPKPEQRIEPAAFDGLAADYDVRFTERALGRALRGEVWRRSAASFSAGDRILDLGCGSGVDAHWLASRGCRVVGLDASSAMLERARARCASMPESLRPRFHHVPAERLGELSAFDGPFDGLLSNFGVINCIADLPALGCRLAERMRPGARIVLVVMGPFCLLELLGFGIRLDRRAWRRLGPRPIRAKVGGRDLWLRYPSPERVRAAFGPRFAPRGLRALGLLLPPTDLAGALERRPERLRRRLVVERRLAGLPLAARLSDHYLLELERSA